MTLPAAGYFTNPARTNGEAKQAQDDMLDTLIALPAAVGDVTGPASSTSGNIATFNGTGGKTIADSGIAPGTLLRTTNNLSDISSASSARGNLGLGSAATKNTGSSGATVPLCNTANTWGGQQTPLVAALTDASTVTWDCATAQVATLTTAAARVIGAPTNAVAGTFYSLEINSGGYTPAWNAVFDFGSDGDPSGLTGVCGFLFYYDGSKFRCRGRSQGGA